LKFQRTETTVCTFTPAQTGAAFDELLKWVREKKKPEAGEVK
jgi:hypothetical protein